MPTPFTNVGTLMAVRTTVFSTDIPRFAATLAAGGLTTTTGLPIFGVIAGTVTAGTVTAGTVTAGTVTAGTVTAGTVTAGASTAGAGAEAASTPCSFALIVGAENVNPVAEMW